MRTTLTIDPDVAVALDRLRDERGATLKGVVNEALRRGLASLAAERESPERPFQLRTWNGGGAKVALDSVAEAIAWGEGEGWT